MDVKGIHTQGERGDGERKWRKERARGKGKRGTERMRKKGGKRGEKGKSEGRSGGKSEGRYKSKCDIVGTVGWHRGKMSDTVRDAG